MLSRSPGPATWRCNRVMAEDEQELANRLAEELTKLRVEDFLIQTIVTVSAVGYRRLGLTPDTKADRDLDQARLAIETMRALIPLLEHVVPAELARDFTSSVANLQLAYAKAAGETTADPATPPKNGDPRTPPPSGSPAGDPATPHSSGSSTGSPTGETGADNS